MSKTKSIESQQPPAPTRNKKPPCPFCGSRKIERIDGDDYCDNCGARGPNARESVYSWSSRADSESRSEEALTVEAALQELREMFPGSQSWQITCYTDGSARNWRLSGRRIPIIAGTSLEDCMAKVRAAQAERNGGVK